VINNEPVRIGYGSTSYTVMDGQIDEVRIYNYDRTADQISQDYGFSMPTYTQFPGDTDGDGYGTNGISDVSCAPLANYGVKSNDCDDSTSGSGAYSTTITGSAPIASWSFDETSGTLVKEDIDSYRRRRRAELMAKNQCFYGIPYSGECCEPADESGFCKEHKGLKCRCGRQATHGSSETTTGFVMGDPLCDEHSQ